MRSDQLLAQTIYRTFARQGKPGPGVPGVSLRLADHRQRSLGVFLTSGGALSQIGDSRQHLQKRPEMKKRFHEAGSGRSWKCRHWLI